LKPNGCLAVRQRSSQIWQPLDAVSKTSQALPRVCPAMNDRARFQPAAQYEGALEQPWMRQGQFWLVEFDIVIGDQIEIERARSPAFLVGAVAAEFCFDLVQCEKKRMRI